MKSLQQNGQRELAETKSDRRREQLRAALAHLDQAIAAAPQEVALAAIAAQAMLQKNDARGAEQILKREVNAAAHADLLSQLAVEL